LSSSRGFSFTLFWKQILSSNIFEFHEKFESPNSIQLWVQERHSIQLWVKEIHTE